jgi:flagellar biosynthesis GTPase FlhF
MAQQTAHARKRRRTNEEEDEKNKQQQQQQQQQQQASYQDENVIEFRYDNNENDEEEEEEDKQEEEEEEEEEDDDAELTPTEKDFKDFWREVAGSINVPLSELFHIPKHIRRRLLRGRDTDQVQVGPKHAQDSRPTGGLPAPFPTGPPSAYSAANTHVPSNEAILRARNENFTQKEFREFLTNTAMSAFLHVLYVIKELKNPAVSYLSPVQLLKRHRAPLVSWVGHMVQYNRNIAGDSPLYKSRHAMFALSNMLERHRLLFSKMS